MHMLGNALGRALHIADIRLLMRIQRRRHADCNKVHVFHKRKVICCGKHAVLYHLGQVGIHHIPDVVFPFVDKPYFFALHVKANGLKPSFCLLHCQGQSHVTKSNYTHNNFFVFDFGK